MNDRLEAIKRHHSDFPSCRCEGCYLLGQLAEAQELIKELHEFIDELQDMPSLRAENARLRELVKIYVLDEHRLAWAGLSVTTAEKRRKKYGDGNRPFCPCDGCEQIRAALEQGEKV